MEEEKKGRGRPKKQLDDIIREAKQNQTFDNDDDDFV